MREPGEEEEQAEASDLARTRRLGESQEDAQHDEIEDHAQEGVGEAEEETAVENEEQAEERGLALKAEGRQEEEKGQGQADHVDGGQESFRRIGRGDGGQPQE